MPTRKETPTPLGPIFPYFGGKGRMLNRLRPIYPRAYNRYLEPFLGGGAVLFDLAPARAIVGDKNEELVQCYQALQKGAQGVVSAYQAVLDDYAGVERNYYAIRDRDRDPAFRKSDPRARAARFLFLCYAGFNGRYHVNRKGCCTTTWGGRPRIANQSTLPARLLAVGEYLATHDVQIHFDDGWSLLSKAKEGDFVFLDPPYLPISKTAKFTEYTPGGFGFADQARLLGAMEAATGRGVMWAYTNADRPWLWESFGGKAAYHLERVQMLRSVAGDAKARGSVQEILITNYNQNQGA